MTEIKKIPATIKERIQRSFANFCNHSGVDKLYYIFDCIDTIKSFIEVNHGEQFLREVFNEEIKDISQMNRKIKDYESFVKFLEEMRPKINKIQMFYDRIDKARIVGKEDRQIKENMEIKLSKMISPYQTELYRIFMMFLKITEVQDMALRREYLRSPESSKYSGKQFQKGDVVRKNE